MKKIILLIVSVLIIFLTCLYIYKPNFQKLKQTKDNNIINKPKKEEETDIISEYVDNNPIIIGLYKNYRNGINRKLITSYESKWQYHQDISSFEVYYTNEQLLNSDVVVALSTVSNMLFFSA